MVALDPVNYAPLWTTTVGAWMTDIQLDPSAGRTGTALLPDQNAAKIVLVDVRSHRVICRVPVGNEPTYVSADSGTGYVTNQRDGSVSIFNRT